MIEIFENIPLELDEVDFTMWLTDDGEYEDIVDLTDEDVTNVVYTLKRKLKMLPEHVNVEIWEEYLNVFLEECEERGIEIQ